MTKSRTSRKRLPTLSEIYSKFIFVTDRVVRLMRRERVTGCTLAPVSELECNSAGLNPGRLSYWMPEARARELGEPLGIY